MTEQPPPLAGDAAAWDHLLRGLAEIVTSIDDSLAAGRTWPALVLLYAGIDLLAWLDAAEGQTELRGADFKTWCLKYLLPESGLECNANELWAARCALLHNAAAEGREMRKDTARAVVYTAGDSPDPPTHHDAALNGQAGVVVVAVQTLFAAFREAVSRYCEEFDRPGAPGPREIRLLQQAADLLQQWPARRPPPRSSA